jgi:Zn-finger nucleic acid-binding protein
MTEERAGSLGGLLCPVCRVSLVMAERQNVEIDYCPQCRGVGWTGARSTRSLKEVSINGPHAGHGTNGRKSPMADMNPTETNMRTDGDMSTAATGANPG